jgi:hypothetical protein
LKDQANNCIKIFLDKFEFKNYRDKYFFMFIYYVKTGKEKELINLIKNINDNFILIFTYYRVQSPELFNIFYFILNDNNIKDNIKNIVKNFVIEENKYNTYIGKIFQNIDNNKKIINEINELLKRKNSANSYEIERFVSNVVKNIIDFVEFSYIKNILRLFDYKEIKEDLFVFTIKRLESNKLYEEYDYIMEKFFTLSSVYKFELIKTCFQSEEKFKNLKCVYTKQHLIENIDISETLEILSILAPNEVLKHFGIEVESDKSKLESLIEETKEKLENLDKKAQKRVVKDFKEKILADEKLTSEFIEKYGEEFDIESEEDFDELTLGNFKEAFMEKNND